MRSLTEWYRYVDRVSRPAHRSEEEAAPFVGWRPWLDEPDPEPAGEPVPMEQLPDLSDIFEHAANPEAAAPAREEFEDLTVHDELPAIPEFGVPQLEVPKFEVTIPRWAEIGAASEPAESAGEPESPAEIGSKGGAAQTVSSAVARIKASPNWDLLNQIREEENGDGARARLRETRKELIERLVDPTLSLEQTAVILGVCPTTVRRYTNKGLLRHFRTKGNQRRFRLSDVAEFMEARSAEIEADSRAERAAGEGPQLDAAAS